MKVYAQVTMFAVLLMTTAINSPAQTLRQRKVAVGKANSATDDVGDRGDQAIMKLVDSYVDAFNKGDAAEVAGHWSEDGVYVNRTTGERLVGGEQIEASFTEMFANGPVGELQVDVESIRLVTPDVAVEDGRVRFIAPIGPADTTSYTAIYVREENEWKLDSIRETASLAPPSNYDLLSQWEWMVGNWTDELDDWKVESSCRWSANRNFLTRTFEVSRDGHLQIQGTQVIGYDPVVSAFKCWTFHSGGGYGEGTLEMKDGRWVFAAAGDASLTSEPGYFPVRRSKEAKWSIDTIGEVSLPLASPDEKRTEELQWMVGRWVDKDGDVTITTTGSWTPNKAFLQRSFKVVVQDRVGLAGMQVIGWDADAKKFCSWVFDSSGGFANEEWSKESDHWIVRSAGVLFGGRKVSSVRIITPIDDNTLTLKVVDRDGGGELLPDIDKVTIVRDQANE